MVYGSPRGRESSTAVFGRHLTEGLAEAGTELEEIWLKERKIHPCTGCYRCWTETPGVCIFRDDMPELLPRLVEADLIVHVYPLYYSSMPGIMKTFMDRTLPLNQPELVDRGGLTGHPERFGPEPPVFLVCGAGFPEREHFDALVTLYRQLYGQRFLGAVLAGGAEMARMPAYADFYGELFRLSRQAGLELGTAGRLSDTTAAALDSSSRWPAERIAAFREAANGWWKSSRPDTVGSLEASPAAVKCRISTGGMSTFLAGMAMGYRKDILPELTGILQFRFETGSYFLKVANGVCEAWKGEAEKPLLTLECAEKLWLDISEGVISGETATLNGQLKVTGEMGLLLRMDQLFGGGGGGTAETPAASDPVKSIKAREIPDHRGPVRLPGMLWFQVAFLPWILLWAGEPLFGFQAARLAAAGFSLLLFLYHRITNRPTLFETGTLFYTLASALAASFLPGPVAAASPVVDQLFLAGLWLGSLAGTFSVTAEYSRLAFPRPVWKQPSFLKTNDILVVVWGINYLLSATSGTVGLLRPELVLPLKIAGYIVLAPMLLFTFWFSGWYPKRMMLREG